MTFLFIFLLSFLLPALAVPLHRRSKEDSVSVELLHLAVEKGPITALGVGGVVLLALFLREATDKPAIVYTDHSATVNIAFNTNLRSAATENQNLRLVRAAQFIQTFNLSVLLVGSA